MRSAVTSTFIRAISTPVGHSRLQALQDTQSFIVSAISSLANAAGPSWPDRARRRLFARPLVESRSSRVARKDGHITPRSNLRHAPLLLHISTAPCRPPALPGHASQFNRVGKSSILYPGENRKSERSSIFGALVILPGLKISCGSNICFTCRNRLAILVPNITSLNSERAMPSPCSPECEPPYSLTSLKASSAMPRMAETSSAFFISNTGRT